MVTTPKSESALTPAQVVSELDRYIVGQHSAKRAVAIALRNRWRRSKLPEAQQEEISPKNIILIGATGVGKTEIARRLAKLAQAPFLKVEASKFTEVGYVGRDVESIVRDLTEAAIQMARDEALKRVQARAVELAEERLLDILLPRPETHGKTDAKQSLQTSEAETAPPAAHEDAGRKSLRRMLKEGALDGREVEIEAEERRTPPNMQLFTPNGVEDMSVGIGDLMQQFSGTMLGPKRRKRRVKVPEARVAIAQAEAHKLIDQDEIVKEGIFRAEQRGIIFLDEIDKIARRESQSGGPDVSREGVQRDILPIVEGSSVTTKHGRVRTDHMLFIAAGAFHVAKVSDLIPELQGRFPIRVELDSLGEEELLRILKEPTNALPSQYAALLQTEGVTLSFEETGLAEMAHMAAAANRHAENIGARRLHTVIERLLEDISFEAPQRSGEHVVVDAHMVRATLADAFVHEDLDRYIL